MQIDSDAVVGPKLFLRLPGAPDAAILRTTLWVAEVKVVT